MKPLYSDGSLHLPPNTTVSTHRLKRRGTYLSVKKSDRPIFWQKTVGAVDKKRAVCYNVKVPLYLLTEVIFLDNRQLLDMMEECGHFLWHRQKDRRGQMRILKAAAEKGEISQTELRDRLGIQSGSLSELVLKTEAKGFITREKDENDKRRLILRITPEGEDFLRRKEREQSEEDAAMFDILSEEEKKSLCSMLSRLLSDREKKTKPDSCCRSEREV